MNVRSNRFVAAMAAVLVASATSGCVYSLLPYDRGDLAWIASLSAVHDSVEAAAATAPASAEASYNRLRRDFNDYINRKEIAVTAVGASIVMVSKVTLDDTPLSADTAIQDDLATFAAAAPTAPSGPVFSGSVNATDALTVRIYPAADAIKDSRSGQAATINQGLEKFKLAPWAEVNRQAAGTR